MNNGRMRRYLAVMAIAAATARCGTAIGVAPAPACTPELSERDVEHGFTMRVDCGLSTMAVRHFIELTNHAAQHSRLPDNRRAALANAANIMLSAVHLHAFENVAPLVAALAAGAKERPDTDFVAIARQWATRYGRLLSETSITRTSDPTEIEVDNAIERVDLDSASKLLAMQLTEPRMPDALMAARSREAALVAWLRFDPQQALAYAKAAFTLQPKDIDITATYAELLDDEHAFERALPLYERLLLRYQSLAHDKPDVWRPRIAQVLNKLGHLYAALQLPQEAEMSYMHALGIYWGLARVNPTAYGPAVEATFDDLGMLYRDTQRLDDAVQAYGEALKLDRALAQRDAAQYEPEVATTLNDLGILYDMTHHMAEAERAYGEALTIQRALVGENPAAYRPALARTLNNLGNLYSGMARLDDAEHAYREALDIRRRLARESPVFDAPDMARTLSNLGVLYRIEGRPLKARRAYREALRTYESLARLNLLGYRPDEARTLNNLGVLLSTTHRPHEAEDAYRRAIALYDTLSKAEPASSAYRRDQARTLDNLARLYSDMGRPRKAEATKREAARLLNASDSK
jgi:tetratricopeptide (TPR) repeat protein